MTPIEVEIYLFHKKRKRPRPSFTYVADGLEVAFTDTSTKNPVTYLWQFGDGNTSTLQNPVHTYAEAGEYTVTLTAFNRAGGRSTSQVVTVEEAAPATYPEAVNAVGEPKLWYKFQGTSGTIAANSGSLGSGWNLEFDTEEYTLGNAGQIGANDAIKNLALEGVYIAQYAGTPVNTFSAVTFARLMFVPAGGLSGGFMTIKDDGTPSTIWFQDRSNGLMDFRVRNNSALTSEQQTTDAFPRGQWFWSFGRWNGTSGASNIRWGYGGALVSPALSVNTSAAIGDASIDMAEFELNRVDGLIDEIILWDVEATDQQLLDIVTLSGL